MKTAFALLLLFASGLHADWTNWRPDRIEGELCSYHRLNDVEISGGYKHFIQFRNVPGKKVHIWSAQCNGSATVGWCELGPTVQEYGFSLEDDNDSSNWTWNSELM